MTDKNYDKRIDTVMKKIFSRGDLDPKVLAIHAALGFGKSSETDHSQLLTVLEQVVNDITELRNGGKDMIEEYLYSQTIALQALFQKMLLLANAAQSPESAAIYGKLALKAQAQCRTTLNSLAELRNPKKAMFIKQQNNAVNQQVNNQFSEKNSQQEKSTNELYKEKTHATLDARSEAETIRINPKVAAMEAVYRAEDKDRQRT